MNDGKAMEQDVCQIHQALMDLAAPGIVVEKGKKLKGRSRDFVADVFFEIQYAYVPHRVVIECKDHQRRVEAEDVEAFATRLHHLIGVHQGVMVSRHGFQNGAVQVAKMEDIIILEFDQLERLALLVNLETALFPDARDVGEPFWTLMGRTQDGFDGTPHAIQSEEEPEVLIAPLFFSKRTAQQYLDHQAHANSMAHWGVCGLRQRQLRSVLLLAKSMRGKLGIMFEIPKKENQTYILLRDPEFIASEFHLDPRVLDDLAKCPQHSEETIHAMLTRRA